MPAGAASLLEKQIVTNPATLLPVNDPKAEGSSEILLTLQSFSQLPVRQTQDQGEYPCWELTNTAHTAKRPTATEAKSFSSSEELLCRPSIPCDVQSKYATGVLFKSLSKKVFILSVSPLAEWLSLPKGGVQWNGNWHMLENSAFHFYPNSSFRGPVPSQGNGSLGLMNIMQHVKTWDM